jgi:DNA-binding NarL/FixJ family response regulator
MFKKVLLVEDMEDIAKGVAAMLMEMNIPHIHQVQYCDDAHLKLKRSAFDNEPYDLVITDLSFKTDHRTQTYTSGEDLIEQMKIEYPALKIIVYSVEDRLQKVRRLFERHHIDAYVCKSRSGLKNLSNAIEAVLKNSTFLSPEVANTFHSNRDLEIDDYDVALLENLAHGLSQEDISTLYKKHDISPASLSSIEKRLNKLRIQFNANNAIHLVAIAKDLGLI